MDIYIERPGREITLKEWKEYVAGEEWLRLEEEAVGVNPMTKQSLAIKMPGRACCEDGEIIFSKGRIGIEGMSAELVERLRHIALRLGAKIYDCGEEISIGRNAQK